ncbi:MAG: histidine kinase N-terminal 7TM domain-containing protein [Planctomycetota bacterium]
MIPAIILPAFAALLLAFVASRSRQETGARSFTWLMLTLAVWGIGNCLERVSPHYSQKLFWANLQYFGLVGVPLSWLALGLDFTGRSHWLTRRRFLAIAAIPILIIVLVWTDPAHGLIRGRLKNPEALLDGAFSVIQFERQPMYWVNVIYDYVLMTIGSVLIGQAYFQGNRHLRAQAGVMLLGAIVPWVSNVTYMLGMNFLTTYDITPFTFSFTVLSAGWCILRYRFLDLVPVARAMVLDSMDDPVIVLDDQDRVLDMNAAAQRFASEHLVDYPGEPIDRIFPERPDLMAKLMDRREGVEEVTLVEGGLQRQFDMRISPLHDRSGRFTGRVIVLRDISARKLAEEANRQSQSQYRALMQQASDGIYVSDVTGTILAANARGCELVGCTEQELIGRNVHEFLSPEDINNDPIDMDELRTGKRVLRERRFRHKSGTFIPVEVSATMLADGRFQAIARDITDRKRAEEERRRLEAEIQHAQKLESLGILAGE